jgi:molybdopterin converting factor subunit 1
MHITLRLFASYREAVGKSELPFEIDAGSTPRDVLARLRELYPQTQRLSDRLAFAVNASYAPADTVLNEGDEVTLIPPVAGGWR